MKLKCPGCGGEDIDESTHIKSDFLGEYVLASCRTCDNVWPALNSEYPCDCDVCKHQRSCPSGQSNYALRMQHCNIGIFEPEINSSSSPVAK